MYEESVQCVERLDALVRVQLVESVDRAERMERVDDLRQPDGNGRALNCARTVSAPGVTPVPTLFRGCYEMRTAASGACEPVNGRNTG